MNYNSDGFPPRKHPHKKKNRGIRKSDSESGSEGLVLRCDGNTVSVALGGSILSCSMQEERPVAGDRVLVSSKRKILRIIEADGNLFRLTTTGSKRIASGVQHLLVFLVPEAGSAGKRMSTRYIEPILRQVEDECPDMEVSVCADDPKAMDEALSVNDPLRLMHANLRFFNRSEAEREQVLQRLRGRRTALIGPSGSGKTSFLSWLIAGADALSDTPLRAERTSFIELFQFSGVEIIDMPGSDRPPMLKESSASDVRSRYVGDKPDHAFRCRHCGQVIGTSGAGTKNRNHCPHCLHSLHVDNEPGDRASLCRSVMEPIAVWVRKDGEWALLHRCKSCGTIHSNRIAADDNEAMLLSLAVRPLANPAFSLERIGPEGA